jgi:hypothetical protein
VYVTNVVTLKGFYMTALTTEEIVEIATKVYGECDWHESALHHLEAFAKLVAAKKEKDIIKTIQSLGTWATCEQIEKAIKVRGIK